METLAENPLDGGNADHLFHRAAHPNHFTVLVTQIGTVLDEDHRHLAPQVHPRGIAHARSPPAVQSDIHTRTTRLAVKPRGRIHKLIPGYDDLTLEQDRKTVTGLIQLAARRNLPGLCRLTSIGIHVDQTKFQRRRRAQNLLCPRCILYAGQLNHNALRPLLLDDWLGDTQLVDAIAQCVEVLLQGKTLQLRLIGFGQLQNQAIRAILRTPHRQLGIGLAQAFQSSGTIRDVTQRDRQCLATALDPRVTHPKLAQPPAQVRLVALEPLSNCSFHVHFQQKVNAAPQIQTQIHRARTDRQ